MCLLLLTMLQIQQAAEKHSATPQNYCDRVSSQFKVREMLGMGERGREGRERERECERERERIEEEQKSFFFV